MDFTKFKSYGENYFLAALALLALRRLRVQPDLLDGTAFEALPLVVYTNMCTTSCDPCPCHKHIAVTYSAIA